MTSAQEQPPLGSWARVYTLVIVLAVALMVVMWWFTTSWNIPAGGVR